MTFLFSLLITSEIWPQPNVVSFHQSVHCVFYQRHIAWIFDILDAGGKEGGVMQNTSLITHGRHAEQPSRHAAQKGKAKRAYL